MIEIWKPTQFIGYEVSNLGRVRSLERYDRLGRRVHAKLLSTKVDNRGYELVVISVDGKRMNPRVHTLVLRAFTNGGKPNGFQACHSDGNKLNNKLSNLRWDTCRANQQDKIRHETIARGVTNGRAVLSEEKVAEIVFRYRNGESAFALSKEFEIAKGYVYLLNRHKTWKWFDLESAIQKLATIIHNPRGISKENFS